MSDFSSEMATRVDTYFEQMVERYRFYLDTLFYPVQQGRRTPLFESELTDREQFVRLQEAQRQALAGEKSIDAVMWMSNEDGAQERFRELAEKFAGERE